MLDHVADKKDRHFQIVKKPTEEDRHSLLTKIRSFDALFWLLVINITLGVGIMHGFLNIGNDYMQTRFGFKEDISGQILLTYYLVSIIITPIAGIWADRNGRRIKLMIIAYIFLMLSFFILTVMPDCSQCYTIVVPIVLLGIYMGIFGGTVYGCFPIIIRQELLGLAYGICYSIQNITQATFPLIVGVLQEYSDQWVTTFLGGVAILGAITTLVLAYADKKSGGKLEQISPVPETQGTELHLLVGPAPSSSRIHL